MSTEARGEEVLRDFVNEVVKKRGKKITLEDVIKRVDAQHPHERIVNIKGPWRAPERREQETGVKPEGTWYGIGSSWLTWLKSESPSWFEDHTYVVLVDQSSILRLRTAAAVKAFGKKYASPDSIFPGMSIDWPRVAQEYSGIEIAPYQHTLRLDLDVSWYYGWDVASGCVWDPEVIEVSERVA